MSMPTLGTDPEICVVDRNHDIVPSGAFFDALTGIRPIIPPPPPMPGFPDKGRTMLIPELGDGFKWYEDGASLEGAFPPVTDPEDMIDNVRAWLKLTNSIVDMVGFSLEIKPSLPITDTVIKRGGVALSRFGCDPDSTPWDDPFNPAAVDAKTCYNRFYGGHIHIGTPKDMRSDYFENHLWQVCAACDLLLGLPDVIFDHSVEARTRRNVYGRAGRHRIQTYAPGVTGFEYRTPSNFWMRHPSVTGWMFSAASIIPEIVVQDDLAERIMNQVGLSNVMEAINRTDGDLAGDLFRYVIDILYDQAPYVTDRFNLDWPSAFDHDSATDWQAAWGIQ